MIFIKIQTRPTDSEAVLNHLSKSIKAPGNYKDKEKIAAYIENAKLEVGDKTGLNPMFGKVSCISFAVDDGEIQTFGAGGESEFEILNSFKEAFNQVPNEKQDMFSGHGILDFDLPFLLTRLLINGQGALISPMTPRYKWPVFDTARVLAFGSHTIPSFSDTLVSLGIECDTPYTGKDMIALYDAESYLSIAQHNETVLQSSREIRNIIDKV